MEPSARMICAISQPTNREGKTQALLMSGRTGLQADSPESRGEPRCSKLPWVHSPPDLPGGWGRHGDILRRQTAEAGVGRPGCLLRAEAWLHPPPAV